MRISPLHLGERLSGVSWFFIELFTSVALFALPFSKSVAEVSFYTALVLWALRKWPSRQPLPSARVLAAAYLALFAAVCLSLVSAGPDLMDTALRGVFKWVKYLGIFWMCAELGRRPAHSHGSRASFWHRCCWRC